MQMQALEVVEEVPEGERPEERDIPADENGPIPGIYIAVICSHRVFIFTHRGLWVEEEVPVLLSAAHACDTPRQFWPHSVDHSCA